MDESLFSKGKDNPLLFHQASDWFGCKSSSVKSEWSMLGGDAPTLLPMVAAGSNSPKWSMAPIQEDFSLSPQQLRTSNRRWLSQFSWWWKTFPYYVDENRPRQHTYLNLFWSAKDLLIDDWRRFTWDVWCPLVFVKIRCPAKHLFFECWGWHDHLSTLYSSQSVSINNGILFSLSRHCVGCPKFREERVDKLSELV